MRQERELIQKFIDKLDAITKDEVRVIASKEQEEQRDENMVVVGITNVTNVNPTLPDYDFTVQILIDSFIKGDEEGYTHDQIVETVETYLETYLNDQTRLAELFDDIPIVGMFLLGTTNSANEVSNQTFIQLQCIGSY